MATPLSCPLWVKRGDGQTFSEGPLYSQERTFCERPMPTFSQSPLSASVQRARDRLSASQTAEGGGCQNLSGAMREVRRQGMDRGRQLRRPLLVRCKWGRN